MSQVNSGSRRGSKTNTSKATGDLLLILSPEHAAAFRSSPKNDRQVIFERLNCPKGTREIVVRGSTLAEIQAWCQQADPAVVHELWLRPDQLNGYIKTAKAKRPKLQKTYSSVASLDKACAWLEEKPDLALIDKYGPDPPASRRSSNASARSQTKSTTGSQTQQRRKSSNREPEDFKILRQQQDGKKLSARQLMRLQRTNGYDPSWLRSKSRCQVAEERFLQLRNSLSHYKLRLRTS